MPTNVWEGHACTRLPVGTGWVTICVTASPAGRAKTATSVSMANDGIAVQVELSAF